MERLRELLDLQAGVVSRRQALSKGLTKHDLERLRRRRELVPIHPGVYVNHTGEPTWVQRAWAAVLATGRRTALSHDSALRAHEGRSDRSHDGQVIHVAVDRGRHVASPDGVVVHRLVRLEDRVLWNLGPPRQRYEDAILEVACAQPTDLKALGVVAAAVQSRRTTATRILAHADQRSRLPRRAFLTAVLRDVEQGACSVLEHGYLTLVERAHGLATGRRQAPSTSSKGSVYRDVEYATGQIVELDGRLFHDSTLRRDADMDRDLDAAVDGQATIRLSWGQVFDRPCWTAGRLGRVLRRQGWTATSTRCGPECSLDD
jgi:hypothetical protein